MLQLYNIDTGTKVAAPGRMTHLPILLLNIHTLCNCRCMMCDIWQRKEGRELHPEELNRHRASLISLGVRQVVLTGGEPLLSRQLPALCEFFHSLDIRITLLTSGLLLHKQAALLSSAVDEIIISLDGPAEIHNTIRGIPRAFEVIARGIQTVRNLNPMLPIACRTTVQRLNHQHLCATVNAARSLGLDSISFLPADLTSAAFNREQGWAQDRQNEVSLDPAELRALEDEIEQLIEFHKLDIAARFIVESESKLRRLAQRFREHLEDASPEAPQCNAPWVSAVLEVDGTLRPCFFHPATASARISTLEEALNSDSAIAFRNQLDVATNPTCRRCVCSLNYRPSGE